MIHAVFERRPHPARGVVFGTQCGETVSSGTVSARNPLTMHDLNSENLKGQVCPDCLKVLDLTGELHP